MNIKYAYVYQQKPVVQQMITSCRAYAQRERRFRGTVNEDLSPQQSNSIPVERVERVIRLLNMGTLNMGNRGTTI